MPTRSATGHRLTHSASWPTSTRNPPSGSSSSAGALHRLSTDFSLLPEMETDFHFQLSARQRIQTQLRRWRHHAIFGIVENKLLCHSLLATLLSRAGAADGGPLGGGAVRQAPMLYGAFATKSLGAWPRYERQGLLAALGDRREFVLKSATNGGGADVLIMTRARWEREGWTGHNVSAYAERFLSQRWFSEWGQRYEHRAVVVQENLSPPAAALPPSNSAEADTAAGALLGASSGLAFEIKANVAFGRLGSARLFVLPKAESVHLELSFCEAGKVTCSGTRCVGGGKVCAAYCKRAVTMLASVGNALESLATLLTSRLAADWYRLDVFVSEAGAGGKLGIRKETSEKEVGSHAPYTLPTPHTPQYHHNTPQHPTHTHTALRPLPRT